VLDVLGDQPRVRDLLASAVSEGRLSHAYLFVGAPGSGMEEAALALAQCVICPNDGCGTCDDCRRVAHRTHPDVQWLSPGSVTGYLVDQVRDLIEGVSRTPSRARAKVYVLEKAGLFRSTSANALLKTIEEPPEGVVFVLLARSVASVLPTIVSRCQVVPFRTIAPDVALDEVMHRSGASEGEARVALAVAGTPSRACEFLASPSRREVRRMAVRILDELARDDSWDVLCSARDLLAAVRVPLKDVQVAQDEAAKESADFLTASALKQVADANKRELTARERSGIMEALAAADSLLRDVLVRCEGVPQKIVNEDAAAVVDRLAASTGTPGALAALDAVSSAGRRPRAQRITPAGP
jgi:DNA polymerase-3 subunit delta'